MAFKLDSKTLPIDVAFTSNGINYPANWLRLTTLDEKKAIGITEVDDEPTYDQRFYWSTTKAKDLAGLQTEWIAKQKETASSFLTKYDWYVIRKLEESTDIPATVSKYRDDVRTVCAARETEIKGVTDVTALKALVDGKFTKWPEEPS
tara:strand:- start:106 stop:549 length:444 start_codon:yes stop_codon:yes gene_type:complete